MNSDQIDWSLPKFRPAALTMTSRNLRVWRKLIIPAVLMNFGEPIIYLFGLGFGLGFYLSDMAGLSYLVFLATGIMASSTMTTASFEGMYSVYTRMEPQKTYDSILATPLEIDDIISGELLWCGIKAMLSGSAILLVAYGFGAVHDVSSLFAIPLFFIIGLTFAGPAIIVASFAWGYDFFQYYFTLIITPMLMLSGVFFPVTALPAAIQPLVQILPLSHAIDLIRPLVSLGEWHNPLLHLGVLVAYAIVGYYFAIVFVRRRFNT